MFDSKKIKLLEAKVDALYDEMNRVHEGHNELAKASRQLGVVMDAVIKGMDDHTMSIVEIRTSMQAMIKQHNKIVSEMIKNEGGGGGFMGTNKNTTVH